ncbi:hypothetical protein HBN50_06555 [Halobacteriovorax sp. GB3]|uniref:hypothetical protein n=1 Tax=Halobacteriovorax sp. GB3 TaxID=2719615 RepID=UPI00235EA31E|nr:hypothetical protein [Halobacteriovorax sp. GB3]MDD0852748.1 hypothetical protein [Halobacteriovorax sp. GB3]
MKVIIALSLLLSLNVTMAKTQCEKPLGVYTDLEMVLNQFVFNNGNPNWGDWCYELESKNESIQCNEELNKWDEFVTCEVTRYDSSCRRWADKEGFASSHSEYEQFIDKCITENFRMLLD